MAQCPSASKAQFRQQRGASEARRSLASLIRDLGALLGLCTFFALAAPVVTADPAGDLTTRFGGVYRRPLTGNPSSLDPAHATDIYAHTVVNQIFDGLVQFDSHLNPVPAIAGFWEASVDGQVWTFYLRKGPTTILRSHLTSRYCKFPSSEPWRRCTCSGNSRPPGRSSKIGLPSAPRLLRRQKDSYSAPWPNSNQLMSSSYRPRSSRPWANSSRVLP